MRWGRMLVVGDTIDWASQQLNMVVVKYVELWYGVVDFYIGLTDGYYKDV